MKSGGLEVRLKRVTRIILGREIERGKWGVFSERVVLGREKGEVVGMGCGCQCDGGCYTWAMGLRENAMQRRRCPQGRECGERLAKSWSRKEAKRSPS